MALYMKVTIFNLVMALVSTGCSSRFFWYSAAMCLIRSRAEWLSVDCDSGSMPLLMLKKKNHHCSDDMELWQFKYPYLQGSTALSSITVLQEQSTSADVQDPRADDVMFRVIGSPYMATNCSRLATSNQIFRDTERICNP